jgi:AraC-like DNA-binding protein
MSRWPEPVGGRRDPTDGAGWASLDLVPGLEGHALVLTPAGMPVPGHGLAVAGGRRIRFRAASDTAGCPVIGRLAAGDPVLRALARTDPGSRLEPGVAAALCDRLRDDAVRILPAVPGLTVLAGRDSGLVGSPIRGAAMGLARDPTDRAPVREIAARLGRSDDSLRAGFRRVTGMPPHRYRLAYRVNLAAWWIALTDLRLAEIALLTGFSEQAHMTRTFARVLGRSPGQVRRDLAARGAADDPPEDRTGDASIPISVGRS